jgi:hypothetical protein
MLKNKNNFTHVIKEIKLKFKKLINCEQYSFSNHAKNSPKGGVYLLIEGKKNLYVGRTKRIITDRIKNHIYGNDCPFAFRIARKQTGYNKAAYKGKYTRKKLLHIKNFRIAYKKAKERIRKMKYKFVALSNPTKQALLEIYVSYILKTPYNDFKTS